MASMAKSAPADKPLGEMNTTPLIDVMLVMLIMFLITLPIQTHAVSIYLPTDGGPEVQALENRITIDRSGQTYWNGERVNQPQLARLLGQAGQLQPDPSLLLQPDAAAPYLIVDQVLALVRRTGAESLAFVGNEQHVRAF
jgi:biopolymer transport protein ExbD